MNKTSVFLFVLLVNVLHSPASFSYANDTEVSLLARVQAFSKAFTALGLAADYSALDKSTCMQGGLEKGRGGNPNIFVPSWVFRTMKSERGAIEKVEFGKTYFNDYGKSKDSLTAEITFGFSSSNKSLQAWYDIRLDSDDSLCVGGMLH